MESGQRGAEPSTGIRKYSSWRWLLRRYRKFQLSLSPQQNLLYGFLTYMFIGWILLSLPYLHKHPVFWLDNLFIATSSISTTGLATVSIYENYNWLGQLVILLMVQIGGVGYMTFTSFIVLSNRSKLTHWHQRILNAEFSMPRGFEVKDFLKSVIVFTILIEAVGALGLYIAFLRAGVEPAFALWSGVYHSISSFCTAGFGLYHDSFEQFVGDGFINGIISVLAICGSMGFIVVTDFWNRLSGKSSEITFTTKIILGITTFLLFFGTIMIYFFEPSVEAYAEDKLLVSFFQSMSALTTVGFNTIPLGELKLGVLLIIILLMYIGASPSGTGGGMKSTTLSALMAVMWSRIRNNRQVTFFGRVIPGDRLYMATSIFMLYAMSIFVATFLLAMTENLPLEQILFEATSAVSTVGLSTGITGTLSDWGKLIIIFLMFLGRLGLLTFGLAILARKKEAQYKEGEVDLAI